MRWLWHKEVKYIPVPAWGRYIDLWHDNGYLTDAANLGHGRVYQVEITQLISSMRDKADDAQSVEALKAYGECISLAKNLLTLGHRAKQVLDDIAFLDEQKREQERLNA